MTTETPGPAADRCPHGARLPDPCNEHVETLRRLRRMAIPVERAALDAAIAAVARQPAALGGPVTPAMVERATQALCGRWGWIVDPRYHADLQAALEAALNGADQAGGSGSGDDGKDLLAEIELPHGYSVVEHLPGTWEYRYEAESGTEMAGSTSWSHPALAAIDAWQWYSLQLASADRREGNDGR